MTVAPSGPGSRRAAPQFHRARPSDLRRARPWHHLGYVIWLLPRRLAALSADLQVLPRGRVLDFGCAEKPYRHLFDSQVEFVGADLPGNPDADVEIRPDGTVPLSEGSFDAVLSTQVLEHVADPGTYLSECYRVLRPGGRMLLSTHGLMFYHPDPVDFWRWTGAGLQRIVEDAGFVVRRKEGIMGLAAVGLQFVQDSFHWRLPNPLNRVVTFLFQCAIAMADWLEPKESREYNSLVLAIVAERPIEGDRPV